MDVVVVVEVPGCLFVLYNLVLALGEVKENYSLYILIQLFEYFRKLNPPGPSGTMKYRQAQAWDRFFAGWFTLPKIIVNIYAAFCLKLAAPDHFGCSAQYSQPAVHGSADQRYGWWIHQ